MIVNHRLKFIYAKAVKVAGESLYYDLADHCDSNDELELAHVPPADIRNIVGDEVWNEYFKFVVIRNPWDVMVSAYFYHHHAEAALTPALFEDFLWWHFDGDLAKNAGGGTNKDMWLIDGERWADMYLRFENLQMDCFLLFQRLGLPLKSLRKIHTQYRPSGLHYSVFYSPWGMNEVARIYAPEIQEFGYEFEHLCGPNVEWSRD